MEKRLVLGLVTVLFSLLLISGVSASFLKGNKTGELQTNYAPGENLKGWINISLQNEQADSIISSSINGSIKLIDLLNLNSLSEGDYSCSPSDCGNDYSSTNGQESKNFALNSGQEKIISFRLEGIVKSISKIEFYIDVANEAACINPLIIDLFNDGNTDWIASSFTDDISCTYAGGKGCFNSASSSQEVTITTTNRCEKVKIMDSGKFAIGAWVRKGSLGGKLTMSLWTLENQQKAACDLNSGDISTSGGEVSCNVLYNNSEIADYYICIKSNQTSDYKTKIENTSPNLCGFFATPGAQTPSDFVMNHWIFGKAAKFGNIGKIKFNQASFKTNAFNYLKEEYGNCTDENCEINCQNGCSIPVKFKASSSVNINILNSSLVYLTKVDQVSNNKTYDTIVNPGRISSGFLQLDLDDANFSVPNVYGNSSVDILLKTEKIINSALYIARIPVIESVSPLLVSAGISVVFTANVSSPANKTIIKYKWDFGDGTTEETTSNSAIHSYSAINEYTLSLSVEDENGLNALKEFSLIAGNPQDVVNLTLKEYRKRITNVTQQIAGFPAWYKKYLENETEISALDSNLRNLERNFNIAEGEDDYVAIMESLNQMQIPKAVKQSTSGVYPLFFDADSIDFQALGDLGLGNVSISNEDAYKSALSKWYDANLAVNLHYSVVSAYYDKETRQVLTYFKLSISPTEEQSYDNYIIIGREAIVNSEKSSDLSGSTGIELNSLKSREVEFIVLGDVNPLELPLTFSPQFKRLEIVSGQSLECDYNGVCDKDAGENWKNCRSDCKPIGMMFVYIILVIFAGFIIYIVLQEWYKRRYESHLFKNRNDLFNLVNFINNALAKGMQKGEIEKRLKQYRWSSEQISYAFKKVKGKKTGMPLEIGIPKINLKKDFGQKK